MSMKIYRRVILSAIFTTALALNANIASAHKEEWQAFYRRLEKNGLRILDAYVGKEICGEPISYDKLRGAPLRNIKAKCLRYAKNYPRPPRGWPGNGAKGTGFTFAVAKKGKKVPSSPEKRLALCSGNLYWDHLPGKLPHTFLTADISRNARPDILGDLKDEHTWQKIARAGPFDLIYEEKCPSGVSRDIVKHVSRALKPGGLFFGSIFFPVKRPPV